MFPFWGPLRNVSAKNAYSQHDVQNINKWAAQNELMVIPLVQTFGHLEFILKLDEFKDLREVPLYPQSICPSQDRSWDVVQEVIDQVIYFKREIIHIWYTQRGEILLNRDQKVELRSSRSANSSSICFCFFDAMATRNSTFRQKDSNTFEVFSKSPENSSY